MNKDNTTPVEVEEKVEVINTPKVISFTIPTVQDIVNKYTNFDPSLSEEDALEAKKAELNKLTKEELIELILESKKSNRSDTVQDLARAILSDPDLIVANYEDIASAIRLIKPGTNTSSKSIASYVSKKREEWNLPQRIRVSRS